MKLEEAVKSGKRFRLPGHRWMKVDIVNSNFLESVVVVYADEAGNKYGYPKIYVDYLTSDEWEVEK